jgi:hypothetical protein
MSDLFDGLSCANEEGEVQGIWTDPTSRSIH